MDLMDKVSHVGLDNHKNFSGLTARDANNRVLFRGNAWTTPTAGSCRRSCGPRTRGDGRCGWFRRKLWPLPARGGIGPLRK